MPDKNDLTDYLRLLNMDDSDLPLTRGEQKEVQEFIKQLVSSSMESKKDKLLDACIDLARKGTFKEQVMARKLEKIRHLMHDACIRVADDILETEATLASG